MAVPAGLQDALDARPDVGAIERPLVEWKDKRGSDSHRSEHAASVARRCRGNPVKDLGKISDLQSQTCES
jgi:hypothetical protein